MLTLAQLYAELKPISSGSSKSSRTFTNWASTYQSLTTQIFQPKTIQQVQLIVQLARKEGKNLRVSGSGHSPSDLVCTNDFIINLDKMQKVLRIDHDNKIVYAEGGIKLHQLHKLIRPHGLAVSSLGSISDQSLAGAISTATHGSGVTYGNLSTFIREITLVLPDENASIVIVSKENDPELFSASLCGLGTTGVIVSLGIQVEDDFKLEEECWSISFNDFRNNWREIAESGEHVRCWWFPQVGEVKISRMNRTKKPLTPEPSFLYSFLFDRVISHHYHKIVLAISRYIPSILPFHAHVMYNLVHRTSKIDWKKIFSPIYPRLQSSSQKSVSSSPPTKESSPSLALTPSTFRVDLSNNIFNYDCGFPQYTYEGCVPYETTGNCLSELEEWIVGALNGPSPGLKAHFPVEIRFTEKDDIWLSPTYERRGTYIGIIQYRPFNLPVPYKSLFKKFESILLNHSGKPHWAKSHNCTPVMLSSMYPKFQDFMRIRKRVDPDGILLNAYIKRHFFGEIGEQVDMRVFKLAR